MKFVCINIKAKIQKAGGKQYETILHCIAEAIAKQDY